MKKDKYWKIPVTWEMYGVVGVKTKNKEEALLKFKEDIDKFELPSESYYVDDSFDQSGSDSEVLAMIEEI